MTDLHKYIEDVDEVYNLIMNLMDDEEREFEIKARIRQSNDMKVAVDKLGAEVKRLRGQYLELRDALVGDSPNWTHDELYGRALELSGGIV